MNEARRERIRELIRTLEATQESVHAVFAEEESAFDDRSLPSRETEAGNTSKSALRDLDAAVDHIGSAIHSLQFAIGDEGLSEPARAPIRRRI